MNALPVWSRFAAALALLALSHSAVWSQAPTLEAPRHLPPSAPALPESAGVYSSPSITLPTVWVVAGNPLPLQAPAFTPTVGASVTYRWERTPVGGGAAVTLQDYDTASTYTTTALDRVNDQAFNVVCKVREVDGANTRDYTSPALRVRTVVAPPTSTPAKPADLSEVNVLTGSRVTFTAPAPPVYIRQVAGSIITYLWQKYNPSTSDFGSDAVLPLASISSNSLTLSSLSLAKHDGIYRYRISETVPGATAPSFTFDSAPIRVRVLNAARLTKQPTITSSPLRLVENADPTLLPWGEVEISSTVDFNNTLPLSFEWEKKRIGSALFDPVPAGELAASSTGPLSGTLSSSVDGIIKVKLRLEFPVDGLSPVYRLRIRNGVSTAWIVSSPITIPVNSPPVLLTSRNLQPDKTNLALPLTLVEGGNGRLSVTPSGNAPFYYRWSKKGTGIGDEFKTISNASASTLTIVGRSSAVGSGDVSGAAGPGIYRVEIVNPLSDNFPTPPAGQRLNLATLFSTPGLRTLQSAEVEVRVIQRPLLSAPALSLSGTLNAKRQSNYTSTDFSDPATRLSLSYTLAGNGSISDGRIVSWQRDGITLIAASRPSASADLGSTLLSLPSTAGLLVGMKVHKVGDPTLLGEILSISGRHVRLRAGLPTALTITDLLLFKNDSNKLPPLIADRLDIITDLDASPPRLYFQPQSQADAWNLRGSYRCLIGTPVGLVTTAATLFSPLTRPIITNTVPSLTTPPATLPNLIVASGRAATMSVAATGTPALKYAWKSDIAALGGKVLGTAASLTRSAVTRLKDQGTYTVDVSNDSGDSLKETRSFYLQVDDPPVLVTPRLTLLDNAGNPTTNTLIKVDLLNRIRLRVTFKGTHRTTDGPGNVIANNMQVRWFHKGGTTPILTQTGAAIQPSGTDTWTAELVIHSTDGSPGAPASLQRPIAVSDSGAYTCEISNLCNLTAKPVGITLTVGEPPVITRQPTFADGLTTLSTVAESPISTVAITANAASPLSYQWYLVDTTLNNGVPEENPIPLAGQTRSVLSLGASAVRYDSGAAKTYFCRVASTQFGFTDSQRLVLTVTQIQPPVFGLGGLPRSIYPQVAKEGEKVIIRGSNFSKIKSVRIDDSNGVSRVATGNGIANLNGLADSSASFVIESDTKLVVTVPNGLALANSQFFLQSGAAYPEDVDSTPVGAGPFTRSVDYENNQLNATILPLNGVTSFIVSGNNSFLAEAELDAAALASRFATPLNGATCYLATVPASRKAVFQVFGLENSVKFPGYVTDFRLSVLKQSTATAARAVGPDLTTLFEDTKFDDAAQNEPTVTTYEYNNNTSSPVDLILRLAPPPLYDLIGADLLGYAPYGPYQMRVQISPASATAPLPAPETSAAESWVGGKTTGIDPVNGESVVSLGADASIKSTSLWRAEAGGAVSSGTLAQGMRINLTGTPGGDDQFSWQLMDSTGKAIAALWIATADGSLRLTDSTGRTLLSTQHITAGEGNWHWVNFEAKLDQRSLTVWMDGVPLSAALPLPGSASVSDLQGVWNLGSDGKPAGTTMGISGFTTQIVP